MAASWEKMAQIVQSARTIAVVGLSDKPDRPSNEIARYLQKAGYRIIPVNPRLAEVLGERAYPSLREISEPVDVVLIFRRPDAVPPVVDDAIAIRAPVVWMQPGAENPEAASRAQAAGLTAVVGMCMRTMHRSLAGSRM
ncbi:MAG TPA: CoA-binding protein [bacterium]|nr:CoA-binding protein [bacterium]